MGSLQEWQMERNAPASRMKLMMLSAIKNTRVMAADSEDHE